MQPHPIQFVDLTVQDLARSVDFYRTHLDLVPVTGRELEEGQAWLSAGSAVLRLTEARGGGASSSWQPDDLQRGFRHVGFKVGDLDERAARLKDAGARFHKEPKDVPGGVHITFFFDPDGVLLEFVEGHLQYDRVEDPGLVATEHARPVPTTPRFDHVAITVDRPAETVERYGRELGFGVAGQLVRADDPRGFEITYLHAGDSVLELFSWGVETGPGPTPGLPDVPGFAGVGLTDDDPDRLADRLVAAGATVLDRSSGRCLLDDGNGLAVALERAR